MNGIIIFKGKYGATLQYALWAGELLNVDVFPEGLLKKEIIEKCDFVILGSSVYVGKMLLSEWIKMNTAILQKKKIFVLIVCGSAGEDSKRDIFIKNNIPETLMPNCTYYFVPGRLDPDKLSWKDKLLVKMGARLEKDPAKKKEMLYGMDEVKKENLDELIKAVNRYTLTGKEASPYQEKHNPVS